MPPQGRRKRKRYTPLQPNSRRCWVPDESRWSRDLVPPGTAGDLMQGVYRKYGSRWWLVEERFLPTLGHEALFRSRLRAGEFGSVLRYQLSPNVPLYLADDGTHWFPHYPSKVPLHSPEHRRDQLWTCVETGSRVRITLSRIPRYTLAGLHYEPGDPFFYLLSLQEEYWLRPRTPRRLWTTGVYRSYPVVPDHTGDLGSSRQPGYAEIRWKCLRGAGYTHFAWAPLQPVQLVKVRGPDRGDPHPLSWGLTGLQKGRVIGNEGKSVDTGDITDGPLVGGDVLSPEDLYAAIGDTE